VLSASLKDSRGAADTVAPRTAGTLAARLRLFSRMATALLHLFLDFPLRGICRRGKGDDDDADDDDE
jgi:hypothetical protein